jgi:mannonate dehydratase
MGGYGATQLLGGYGDNLTPAEPDFKKAGFGKSDDNYMDSVVYTKSVVDIFEKERSVCGQKVQLKHDIHERNQPMEAIRQNKKLQPNMHF